MSPNLKKEVNHCIFGKLLSENQIFKDHEDIRRYVYEKISSQFTKPEEDIVTDGTVPDGFYILAGKGKAAVLVTDINTTNRQMVTERILREGDHFGEVAIIFDTLRTATVRSVDYCWVAKMSIEHFKTMLNQFHKQGLRQTFRDATAHYKDPWKKYIYKMICKVQYLKDFLSKKKLRELVYMMKIQTYDNNDWVLKPGDNANDIMFVTEGQVEVSVCINDAQISDANEKNQRSRGKNKKLT